MGTAIEAKAGRGRGRDANGQSRARMLDAARGLFAKSGFEATSIRQIASELKIVTASLYYHFLTKEEMLHAILRDPLNRFGERAIEIAEEATDPERRLISLIAWRVEAWLEDWDVHFICLNDGQFLTDREDFAYVEEAKRKGYHAMERVLREGVEQGQFRSDLDIYYAIIAISGVLNSACRSLQVGEVHTVEAPLVLSIERFTQLHIDFVLRLVRAPTRIDAPIPRQT